MHTHMMHWSNCSLGEAGEAWVEQPHQAAGIVTDENEEKKKGAHLKKRWQRGQETANFVYQMGSFEGVSRDIQKQGGLGLVCERDRKQPLDR